MIEATCSACGTLNRVSEATVPVGAKFITCADCKSRIAIAPPPPIPPAGKLPTPSADGPRPTSGLDLTDLPAPKRASALGPLPPVPSRPAAAAKLPTPPATPPPLPAAPPPPTPPAPTLGGIAAALDPELPAPKARTGPVPLDFDDALTAQGIVDLPAPKRSAQ